MKRVTDITETDLQSHSIWAFSGSDRDGEVLVKPLKKNRIANCSGKVIATQIQLANGTKKWAALSNLHAENPRLNKHFLTLSILSSGTWFHLARYFDFDWDQRGADALCKFLRLQPHEVFPIRYDVSNIVDGNKDSVSGEIPFMPSEILTREEVIALAVPKL